MASEIAEAINRATDEPMFQTPVLTLEETVAEKLRTLIQRQRPTDLSDLALILREHSDQLDRDHVSQLAAKKFTLVKQGDRRNRIEANVDAMRDVYELTILGLDPDAPPFAEARALVLGTLPTLLP